MVKKNPDYYVIGHKKSSSYVYWFLFGLLVFITIYFPFFGNNLRYQTGAAFSTVFNIIGTICNTFGYLLLALGCLMTFVFRRLGGIIVMVSGLLLVMFGGWLIDPYSFGASVFGTSATPGYH